MHSYIDLAVRFLALIPVAGGGSVLSWIIRFVSLAFLFAVFKFFLSKFR